MSTLAKSGYFRNGLPYKRSGHGPRPLIIFQGLTFEHKPQAIMLMMYKFLEDDYTLYGVLRKQEIPHCNTLGDMADDCAVMVREEFGGPVDILGISTGGSIALHFAADHPDLVRRLVIHSSAHALNDTAKQVQLDVARLAEQGQWMKAWAVLVGTIYPQVGLGKWLAQPLVWLSAGLLSLNAPKDPTDLVVTVAAEENSPSKSAWPRSPRRRWWPAAWTTSSTAPPVRETAAGIPNAKLCLYAKDGASAAVSNFAGCSDVFA
jgi:pimeloyl-ACP methyl ester carboxylesterase